MTYRFLAPLAALIFSCGPVHALTLSGEHLAAAEDLSCVLAEDALGRLDEQQFNQRFDQAVVGFGEKSVDVIYAKALGTIDGLLFGLPGDASNEAARRLEQFSESQRCSGGLAARAVAL